MIVVADTSPLNYLVLSDKIDLLPALFEEVWLPPAVSAELRIAATPEIVRTWLISSPMWLKTIPLLSSPISGAYRRHLGESEAIDLALEKNISSVLMDDARGRRQAQALGLEVSGTIGILERAADLGLVDLQEAIDTLALTNFRLSTRLRSALLSRTTL